MSAHIEAVITRPRPPWLLSPCPCGAIMGKGKIGAYLSARGYDRRGRGGTIRRALSHILIEFTLPHSVAGAKTYLKPNQKGRHSGVQWRGVREDKLDFHMNKEEVGRKKTFEA